MKIEQDYSARYINYTDYNRQITIFNTYYFYHIKTHFQLYKYISTGNKNEITNILQTNIAYDYTNTTDKIYCEFSLR